MSILTNILLCMLVFQTMFVYLKKKFVPWEKVGALRKSSRLWGRQSFAGNLTISQQWANCRFWNELRLRVARWCIFKPKVQVWVNFGRPLNGHCWYILWSCGLLYGPFGLFYGHMVILYIFPRFGILCPEKSGNPASSCCEKSQQEFLMGVRSWSNNGWRSLLFVTIN
jgi:hypothetical protein